jgi:hypothetical protein
MRDENISAGEVWRGAGPVSEGTSLQRTGLIRATAVGITGVAILLLPGKWISYAPPLSAIPPLDATLPKLEPVTTLFDSIVVRVLLPVFTSVHGYIFGPRAKNDEKYG